MKKIVMLLLLALSTASVFTQETVRIYGRVTDFNDNPIDSVTVRVKNKKFENLYETITDSKGYFSMNVLKDAYSSIYGSHLDFLNKPK